LAEFFVSSSCVCVYVDTADGRACRVQFDSQEAAGIHHGAATQLSLEAVQVAARARRRYSIELLPLFERIARERGEYERIDRAL
jgi:hypothetical protein